MGMIPVHLYRLVVQRALGRCEYCGLSQEGQEAHFHIDHVVPVVHGGETVEENLALACVSCSLRKAAHCMRSIQKPVPRRGCLILVSTVGQSIFAGRAFALLD